MARIVGGTPPVFSYSFVIETSTGLTETFSGFIRVPCSTAVVITAPGTLTSDPLTYGLGTGSHVISIAVFTTDDSNCPIKSYEVTTLITGITQPSCPSV